MSDANPLPVFVDLSNVVKDSLLGFSNSHAALSRWDRLRAVWITERPQPAKFILMADRSLKRAMSQADQARLINSPQGVRGSRSTTPTSRCCAVPSANLGWR